MVVVLLSVCHFGLLAVYIGNGGVEEALLIVDAGGFIRIRDVCFNMVSRRLMANKTVSILFWQLY